MTVSAPVAPQSSESPVLLFVTTAEPQVSSPEKLNNQAAKSATLPEPSHSTVKSAGALVQIGFVVSSIVKVAS